MISVIPVSRRLHRGLNGAHFFGVGRALPDTNQEFYYNFRHGQNKSLFLPYPPGKFLSVGSIPAAEMLDYNYSTYQPRKKFGVVTGNQAGQNDPNGSCCGHPLAAKTTNSGGECQTVPNSAQFVIELLRPTDVISF